MTAPAFRCPRWMIAVGTCALMACGGNNDDPLVIPGLTSASSSSGQGGAASATVGSGSGGDPSSPSSSAATTTSAASAGGQGGAAPLATNLGWAERLQNFGDCMSYDDWLLYDLDELPLQNTNNEGACNTCHSGCAGSACLPVDALEAWQKHREHPYRLLKIVQLVYEAGQPVDLVAAGRYVNKGIEPCQGAPCHPDYTLDQNVENGLSDFVSATRAKIDADGYCTEPYTLP